MITCFFCTVAVSYFEFSKQACKNFQELPQFVNEDLSSSRAIYSGTYKTMFCRIRMEDAMLKGQSIYGAEDQSYPGEDGEDDGKETESSDEEALIRLETGN